MKIFCFIALLGACCAVAVALPESPDDPPDGTVVHSSYVATHGLTPLPAGRDDMTNKARFTHPEPDEAGDYWVYVMEVATMRVWDFEGGGGWKYGGIVSVQMGTSTDDNEPQGFLATKDWEASSATHALCGHQHRYWVQYKLNYYDAGDATYHPVDTYSWFEQMPASH